MAQNRISKTEKRRPVSSCSSDFNPELRVFEANKEAWLSAHANDFVVISGSAVAGFFPTYSEAYAAALTQFGIDRLFLIKQVMVEEQVFVVY